MRLAVVGAGLAGLAAAGARAAAGDEVVVWEKSRGAGGRTATRRGPAGLRFDHGAPFLHDGAEPLAALPGLAGHELVLPGGGRTAQTVGDPSANAVAKALAERLDLRPGVRVGRITAEGTGWRLADEDGVALGAFDAVVVAVPAPQAAALLAGTASGLAALAATVSFAPCWTVMAAWDASLDLPFSGAREEHELAWVVAEAPKPGRAAGERWVLQASAELSAVHLESAPEAVTALLLERFARLAGRALPTPAHVAAHRWRFATPRTPLPEPFLREGTLLAAGDWCGGRDAGAALRSGRAAAAALG